jgi:GT2 family glycosyltransferase
MSDPSSGRQRRPRRRNPYRDLIHLLNQRYRREWERAEALTAELAAVRGSGFWRAVACLRRLKARLLPPPAVPDYLPWDDSCPGWIVASDPPTGRVSIIVPFRDRVELLRNCLHSLRASTYRDYEVILVDNGSSEPRTQRYLWRLAGRRGVRVVDCPGPFNFSRLCNEGARRTEGEFVVFLNNDTEVLSRDWLEQLLAVGQHPQVGAVGAMLLYPDRTIQHAGVFPRTDGLWTHRYRGLPADHPGDCGELCQVRAVPAATAACLLMRRERFVVLGGFDEGLPLTFSDVDLCCRLRRLGLLVVVTPGARLVHFESLSRGWAVDAPGEGHLSGLAPVGQAFQPDSSERQAGKPDLRS